ncbi:MAG: ssl1498 family light-harvesting-like protein [Coleofasciculus sp. G1-WW12-02]|uniref:photosystem II assembly protein Psb34 n=1 Tax=Coleofasciculus sp. G1-WW12-02 TaxID=3068483 RepID=UPI0032F7A0E9
MLADANAIRQVALSDSCQEALNGQLNNYAIETPVYYSEYPNSEQQRRYAFQGACAILLVNVLILKALAVS